MSKSYELSKIAYAYLANRAFKEAFYGCFTLYKLTQNKDMQILCDRCSHAVRKHSICNANE